MDRKRLTVKHFLMHRSKKMIDISENENKCKRLDLTADSEVLPKKITNNNRGRGVTSKDIRNGGDGAEDV